MSCRLLRTEGPRGVPLFQDSLALPPTASSSTLPGEGSPALPSGSGEATRLRQRVQELEAELVTRVEEARNTGLREGEARGYERAAATARPVLEKLATAIATIGNMRSKIRTEAERDLVELSLAVARRILRREVSVDPDAIQGLVRAVLDKLQARDITRVRVCPDQQDAVRRCLAAAHAGAVEVLTDASLQPGDLMVETLRGNLDASMETQLVEIERGFADRLR